jgi:hypothetical protein
MQKKSEKRKSEKKLPKLGIQSGHGGKPGRYYVRLNGQRTYLGYENGTGKTPSEVTQSYLEAILKWQKNGCKPIPTHSKSSVSVETIAAKYLGWVESRYSKSHTEHCRVAMQFLIDHCGHLSVDDFTRHTLKHLQEKLEQEGVTGRPYARPLINRYIGFIKTAFRDAEESGLCSESTVDGLERVRPLKRGKTTAHEYESVDNVDTEVVKATLPFMSDIIRAMVQVHLLCTMRSQDVINLRTCDIEMNDPKYPGVWWYAPNDHKTKKQGKKLVKVIPPEAQDILRPFLDAKKGNPQAFLFSPKDAVKKHRETLRENRKSKPTPSQIERAHRAKKRKQKYPLGEQYTTGSYRIAVQRAQDRARNAGVDIPHWFPHQIRHESVSEIKARFGMKAARDMAGHSNSKVTKGYAHEKLERMAKVALKRKRIFS